MSKLQMRVKSDERGIVAIVVTMMMLIIISVIVLGYAQTARREQRAQLDKQLSSRAFYAAESGVNVARAKLAADPLLSKDSCGSVTANPLLPNGSPNPFADADYAIEGTSNTAVTCLTVDPAPTELHFDTVGTTSTIFPVKAGDSPITDIQTIKFEWFSKDGSTVPAACAVPSPTTFPNAAGWSCGSLLRVDIVNTSNSFDRGSLPLHTATFFFYPTTGGGSDSFANAVNTNQGKVIPAKCSGTPQRCSVVIDVTSEPASPRTNFAVRAIGLYKDASLSVSANDTGGLQLPLADAQAVIDSTAKSQDVLRRIRVTVPVRGTAPIPDWAIASGAGICKRYLVSPTDVAPDPSLTNPDAQASCAF